MKLRHLTMLSAASLVFVLVGCGDIDSSEPDDVEVPRDQYPEGPYGTAEGAIVENHTFMDGGGAPMTLAEVRRDEGHKLLLVSTSAGWCTACIEEQPKLQQMYDTYRSAGLVVWVAIFEDAEFRPADPDLAASWQSHYDLTFPVVADTDFVLSAYYDASLTPMTMIVDLRTMKILEIMTGWDESLIEAIVESRL